MTTITWTVTQTDYEVSNGYIKTAHWTSTATDGDYTASIYSTCSFGEGTPQIPYAQVTEAEVLNWIWANGVDKEATEAAIQSQINALINPPVVALPLPWAQS